MAELAPGVSIEQKQGGHVHAFLLEDGEDLTLIDTLYDTDGHRVREEIAAIGRGRASSATSSSRMRIVRTSAAWRR